VIPVPGRQGSCDCAEGYREAAVVLTGEFSNYAGVDDNYFMVRGGLPGSENQGHIRGGDDSAAGPDSKDSPRGFGTRFLAAASPLGMRR